MPYGRAVEPSWSEDLLAARLGERPWGVAVVEDGSARSASHHLPADATVELGSVSKAVTGLLLHDALDRRALSLDDPLSRHLPLAGSAAGDVTLGALATHTSGLPRLPVMEDTWRRSWRLWRHADNPYGDTLATLLEQSRATPVRRRRRPAYSNLGFELLGHAVAAAQGTTYAVLVRDRLADPLGLGSWSVPASVDELGPGDLRGTTRGGRPAAPWTGEALGPAGGLRSTLADAATFAAGLLAGDVPGTGALDPVAAFAVRTRIGAAWLVSVVGEHELTWHNGATGGCTAYVGLDRRAGRGVVVVRGTARSADAVGVDLLRDRLGSGGS